MSSQYRHTLQLPKTQFPMRANLAQREPDRLAHWSAIGLHQLLCQQGTSRPHFILHDGPPYANGPIHLGHAVNKILKDIILKSKTASGYFAPYVPGWDCHGLPIELNVERRLKAEQTDLTADAFRHACRDYARQQIDLQRSPFKRLGIIGDWEHPYITMDKRFEANVVRTLADIIQQGHLDYGYKPVHWCIACKSALAEAEVEYRDKTDLAIDVAFQFAQPKKVESILQLPQSLPTTALLILPIWTTTPWTLPANAAVAVHPDLAYVLIAMSGERYLIVAKSLAQACMTRYGFKQSHDQFLATFLGQSLAGLMLQHPLEEREVPIVLGRHVTVDMGTGAVHTAPAHGQEDYQVAVEYQLPIETPIDARGHFDVKLPRIGGKSALKANEIIVDWLKETGSLLHEEPLSHSYPHCWRHKTPLMFKATRQWFISLDKASLRQMALSEVRSTTWFPHWGESRMEAMLMDRPDWCISRQRLWGTPLPLWVHRVKQTPHPKTVDLMYQVADRIEQSGLAVWETLSLEALLDDPEKDQYEKSTDTLDVWFDSGVTHRCVLQDHTHLSAPADLYVEGSDQYRGWFQSSLLTSVALSGKAPYKAVLTHGFTVDEQGHKMSKSLGNVIDPIKVVNRLGADILRLWVASTNYQTEMRVSDAILDHIADIYRRIRNTARFLLANLHDFNPNQHKIDTHSLLALDRWILDRAARVQETLQEHYNSYEFHRVCREIQHFCSIDLGGFYLDIIKDRQYTESVNSVGRRSAQTVMYHILEALVRWLAPILSFTADEIWQFMPHLPNRPLSVFLTTWYTELARLAPNASMGEAYWHTVICVRNAVNKELEAKRHAKVIGSNLQAEVVLYCEQDLADQLYQLGEELKFVLITSSATVLPADRQTIDQAGATDTELPGLWVKVIASQHKKCVRCWHYRAEVGAHHEHPELCSRCISNLSGGTERHYA